MRGGGVYSEQVDPKVKLQVLGIERARWSLPAVVRCVRQHPRVPVLVFAFELLAVMAVARRLGLVRCPIIYRESNMPSKYIQPRLYWFYRWALAACDLVIAQNKAELREMVELGVPLKRKRIIPNPVPHGELKPFRRLQNTEPVTILAAGRLEHQKGFDQLIKGFAAYIKVKTDARLTILGIGSQMTALRKLVTELGLEGKVEFPGFVKDISAYYASASVFVLSSRFEGMPNVLVEALAAGCRVVATESGGGVRELLTACGLHQFVLSQPSFIQSLPGAIDGAIAASLELWESAKEILTSLCDEGRVSDAYWRACVEGDSSATEEQCSILTREHAAAPKGAL
jgi:glycosyltransferase involved in cell wall biosynthesis